MILEDTYIHKGLRRKLVDLIREKGIKNENVLMAIGKIPRHLFIQDSALLKHAYEDKPFPIGAGQTISQPYTVAFQTELLKVKKNDKVLEIGTGSGYQSCVLLELGAKVRTIERQRELFDRTKVFLPKLGYNPSFHYGDGYKGLPTFAPFDKIIITCGASELPIELFSQLKVGGIIVIPFGQAGNQIMTTYIKHGIAEFEKMEYGNFSFVPMLKDKN